MFSMLLPKEKIEGFLASNKEWKYEGNKLVRTYSFKDFASAVEFLGVVRPLADSMNHHPDVCVNYNKVEVSLTTHDEGGVTEKDLELARKMDEVYKTLFS